MAERGANARVLSVGLAGAWVPWAHLVANGRWGVKAPTGA